MEQIKIVAILSSFEDHVLAQQAVSLQVFALSLFFIHFSYEYKPFKELVILHNFQFFKSACKPVDLSCASHTADDL